ncbi:MAG: glutamate-5-semialdehyde dehydrogenase [Leptospiraceae bacterium]|nr:glutamate-5-semialdehyde dehydrogenase [Leptospiraceae bacterium]MCK6379750.1 glutamate-5-semialdehyde dehydrogenase [Leptospiraceae bacterium]NUM40418.1 glutamate-5-semialdehyde dehydrogenase [Leptospiraceae bacterium]
MDKITKYTENISNLAFKEKKSVRKLSTEIKNKILFELSEELIIEKERIIASNKIDIEEGKKKNLSLALIDRLILDEKRILALSNSVKEIVSLPDPIGEVVRGATLPNGLKLITKRVPLGVILVIYESRPNVTIDVGALSFKSGNVCILRGGSEAVHTNSVLVNIFSNVLERNNAPKNSVVFIDNTDREILIPLLKLKNKIDIVVPRGGEGLIRFVSENSQIPIVMHDKGVCNLYVDKSADPKKLLPIVLNSKTQRPGVCNALENLIFHKSYPEIKEVLEKLNESGVELYLDKELTSLFPNSKIATEEEFKTEFLDMRLSVKLVNTMDEAIEFIEAYSSGHTEAIVSEDYSNIQKFLQLVDSAAVFVNTSTRFHDGGELGLGAEVGISTGKLHVRGPMGLPHLTTTTTYLFGEGQVRR